MTSSTLDPRIADSLGKYSPAIETTLAEARTRLRAKFPRGFELVFDNYNALVFGISPTERASDSFVSVAGYPKWVTLFFLHGADLNDPAGLLEGDGKQVRSIRLRSPADLDTPEIDETKVKAALSRAQQKARNKGMNSPGTMKLVPVMAGAGVK